MATERGGTCVDTPEPHVTVCIGWGNGRVQLLPLNNKKPALWFVFVIERVNNGRLSFRGLFSILFSLFLSALFVMLASLYTDGINTLIWKRVRAARVHKSFGIKDHSAKRNYCVAGKARRKQTR